MGYTSERADVPCGHVRVGVDPRAGREPVPLHRASPVHALTHGFARLTPALIGERAVLDGRDLEVDVDAVEQRTGHAREVALHAERAADTVMLRISEIAAGTGVHRGGEHEARGIGEA